jgi:hypothetical protein
VNFNVYLDDDLARRLAALAKRTGAPRNALIRQAVAHWLARATVDWPAAVLAWEGDPACLPFEGFRSDLAEPSDDPLVRRVASPRRRRPR